MHRLGATGKYPDGRKLDPTDEGELHAAIATDHANRMVRIEFGKPVAWLCLPPADAVALAAQLVERAKDLGYDG